MRIALALLAFVLFAPGIAAQTNEEKPTDCTGECLKRNWTITGTYAEYKVEWDRKLNTDGKDREYSDHRHGKQDATGQHISKPVTAGTPLPGEKEIIDGQEGRMKDLLPEAYAYAQTMAENLRRANVDTQNCSTGCSCSDWKKTPASGSASTGFVIAESNTKDKEVTFNDGTKKSGKASLNVVLTAFVEFDLDEQKGVCKG
jgi:hypothetical protein